MADWKYNIGDKVVYDGLVATIERRDVYALSLKPCYSLVAVEDNELSCTASEEECEPYNGEEFDQSEKLDNVRTASAEIAHRVDSITDKYYRDGNH